MRMIDGDDLVKRILEISQEPHADPIYRAFHIAECRRFAAIVGNAPELDVPSVIHARWIPEERNPVFCRCSNCNHSEETFQSQILFYCYHCGARMNTEEGG